MIRPVRRIDATSLASRLPRRHQPQLEAIRVVAAGDALLAPSVTKRVIEQFARLPARAQPPPELSALTPRERDVLKLVGAGGSNAEIAAQLYVSEATVKTHLARILAKLALRDRIQAVVYAHENALVDKTS